MVDACAFRAQEFSLVSVIISLCGWMFQTTQYREIQGRILVVRGGIFLNRRLTTLAGICYVPPDISGSSSAAVMSPRTFLVESHVVCGGILNLWLSTLAGICLQFQPGGSNAPKAFLVESHVVCGGTFMDCWLSTLAG